MPENAAPMTHIPAPAPPAPPLSAARQADAASQLADRLSDRPADATFGDGFAAVTHALLAGAAATQAAGNDVSDALAGVAAHLADIDASLAIIAGTGSRRGRWRPWRRRRHSAAGQAGGCPVSGGRHDGVMDTEITLDCGDTLTLRGHLPPEPGTTVSCPDHGVAVVIPEGSR